jgi:hypothetical protein
VREDRHRETRDAVDDDEHGPAQHERGARRFPPSQVFTEDQRRQQDEGDRLDRDEERRIRRRGALETEVREPIGHAEAEDSHPDDLSAMPPHGRRAGRPPQERQQDHGSDGESGEREQRWRHVEQRHPLRDVGGAIDDVGEEEHEVGAVGDHTRRASPR